MEAALTELGYIVYPSQANYIFFKEKTLFTAAEAMPGRLRKPAAGRGHHRRAVRAAGVVSAHAAGPVSAGHGRQPGHGALLLHQPQFHHHHRPVRGQRPHPACPAQ